MPRFTKLIREVERHVLCCGHPRNGESPKQSFAQADEYLGLKCHPVLAVPAQQARAKRHYGVYILDQILENGWNLLALCRHGFLLALRSLGRRQ